MTQSELITAIASQTGTTKSKAKEALEAVLTNIASGVRESKKLTLPGFGTFKAETRKARVGRNPSTGGTIQIPAKEVVKFKPLF